MVNQVTVNAMKEAFELQEDITATKKALKEKEDRLKNLIWQLERDNVGRVGRYELRKKIVNRDAIVSDLFRARWPDAFNRLAKVTLKDARAEKGISEGELQEVCKSSEIVSWKVIFYGRLGE